MNIPKNEALNKVESSSKRDAANQVLYIPTKVKITIQ